MRDKRRVRGLAAVLAMVLALAVFALPVLAASENAQAVLDQLAMLRRADISPEWPPDVQHNEAHVQQLLDLYLACDAEERAEFTAEENAGLRAYFETLYSIQGRNTADVDALFEGAAPPPPDSSADTSDSGDASSSVSDSAESETAQDSSQPAESGADSSAPASSSTPAPASSDAGDVGGGVASGDGSIPSATYPPQVPKEGGWLSLFGNRGLSALLLVVLLGLALVVFIRFLVALRAAKPAAKAGAGDGDYDEVPFEDPFEQEAARVQQAPVPPADDPVTPPPQEDDGPAAMPEAPAPVAVPPMAQEGISAGDEAWNPYLERPEPEVVTGAGVDTSPDGTDGQPVKRKRGRPPGSKNLPKKAPPPLVEDEPTQPPVTLRSFSGQRTGRPPKRTFRQGDPDDIDAIDE